MRTPSYLTTAGLFVIIIALGAQGCATQSGTSDEVAKEACMEPSHFSKIFKEVNGRGFRDYLNDCRISRATEILSNGSRLSITELALAVGFGDITTFERIFKKNVGVTPMQFRNSISPSVKATTDASVA